ncbi:MAG: ribosomal protein S18-alanine N-acetyltransferase [Halanaeroarchaeum sp.]
MSRTSAADAATIRRAVRADLLGVVRIERAAFAHPWSMETFERFLGGPGFLVAVIPGAEGPGRDVVGYVVATGVRVNGRRMGHVKDIAVAPDREGEGLGTRLLDRAMVVLARQDYDRVRLEVRRSNDRARALYGRFGFERVQTYPEYYPDGEDAAVLHARL